MGSSPTGSSMKSPSLASVGDFSYNYKEKATMLQLAAIWVEEEKIMIKGLKKVDFGRRYRRILIALICAGAVVQFVLGSYFISIAHEPTPRDVPVGVVANKEVGAQLTKTLEEDGTFKVTDYDSASGLRAAIKERDVYGGFDFSADQPVLYTASASGALPTATIKATFNAIVQSEKDASVEKLSGSGASLVPLETVGSLAADPKVVDVVPLPKTDSNGGSIAAILQVISLGGAVASLGLGQLIPKVRRSFRRAFGHVGTLLGYAAMSAVIMLLLGELLGIGEDANHWRLFIDYGLVSLAIIGSTAGAVALVGPAGSLLGVAYFLIGTAISGASIPPEFMSDVWGIIGMNLPTGAGVSLMRNALYFPEASSALYYAVLLVYAFGGVAIVYVTNLLPNRDNKTSVVDLEIDERVVGEK